MPDTCIEIIFPDISLFLVYSFFKKKGICKRHNRVCLWKCDYFWINGEENM